MAHPLIGWGRRKGGSARPPPSLCVWERESDRVWVCALSRKERSRDDQPLSVQSSSAAYSRDLTHTHPHTRVQHTRSAICYYQALSYRLWASLLVSSSYPIAILSIQASSSELVASKVAVEQHGKTESWRCQHHAEHRIMFQLRERAHAALAEPHEPLRLIRGTGCLLSLHELIRWGGRRWERVWVLEFGVWWDGKIGRGMCIFLVM